MSLYGDKVTYSIGSGKDNLTQSAGTAVDNFTKAAGTAVDNLAYPLTRASGAGAITGDTGTIPGGSVPVLSTNGFDVNGGDAYIKIGSAFIKFSYTEIIANDFIDCHSYDDTDYTVAAGQEVYLNVPRSL